MEVPCFSFHEIHFMFFCLFNWEYTEICIISEFQNWNNFAYVAFWSTYFGYRSIVKSSYKGILVVAVILGGGG